MNFKIPLDIKIIAWLFIAIGIVGTFCSMLLITGIAYSPSEEQRKVFFGTITLLSDKSSEIYFLVIGLMNFVTGYILKKGYKIGWWLAFIGCIITLSDSISLGFSKYIISALTGIFVSSIIIIWLICRRNLYFAKERTE